MNTVTLDISDKAQAMVSTLGDELGAKYFRSELFESVMRPSYDTREADSTLPEADSAGAPLEFASPLTEKMYGRTHVYTFEPADYDKIILYVHGGAYVHNAAACHAVTCDKLSQELHARVCVPMYTLAPQGTWKEAYALLHTLWDELTGEHLPVYLMGDSAGGGLALGFAEELAEMGAVMPAKMVLFSPWADVTMTNPDIGKYEEADVSLAAYGLIECGKMWAGGLDVKDRRISPLYYAHFEKLPDTLLFVGTAEIFCPDDTLLAEKLAAAGRSVTLVKGTGLFHVFPVYYDLPESDKSRALIKEFIEG